ncbi:hypothetical protein PR202_ga15949 [Eleusine coracana subsp. coracana]|uniref:RING-type E3 ubiquitin transferase n=1 Tax=Eleusine coracana subsp. coracana TaxID=191504 RepID=A0AAV5CLJ7_ELECO|nr:hypothetical protein QOZ80_6BG0487330 [Eleusine coracana subsp. coracana]GJM98897.1 hypothetical protein PR202_ga15949 [Eleusine coracana subsp. coracana]
MGAARPRRWKLPFHRSSAGGSTSAPTSPSTKSSSAAAPGPCSPARSAAWAEDHLLDSQVEEAVPPEFVCPISGALMADPVILPSGRTYERACLRACAELAFLPPGVDQPGGADAVVIPNTALKAAIGTWCARTGRDLPARMSDGAAREAVMRVMRPPAAEAEPAKSVRTNRRPAALAVAAVASSSNSSYSSPASTSSYGSSSEITAAEDDEGGSRPPVKAALKEKEAVLQAEPADPLEDEVVAKVMDSDDEEVVTAAMAALREATREGAARRRALCTPRLLGALRRVLLLHRHAPARAHACAALVNLSLEPSNKVRIVRAGAVPALVEVLRSPGSVPEAREHAAGALFGLALHEDNRAAIGVLGAVPPLLDLLASSSQPVRARRDAGMALYHLSLAAVNQSKIARFPGAPKALLAVASNDGELGPIRRLALMVTCNVASCAEGRAALMDAGAVASVSGILLSSSPPTPSSHDAASTSSSSSTSTSNGAGDLEEWCVAALYAMSRGSLRFRGLARAAGADKALRRVVAEEGGAGVRREMARKTLRAMRGDLDEEEGNDLTGSSLECGDGEDCGGSIVSDGLMSFRRRQRELGVSSCGNTAEF